MSVMVPCSDVTAVSTIANNRIGERTTVDGKEYVYVKAVAAVLQGDCLYQKPISATVLMHHVWKDQSADCGLVAGVAVVSMASGEYGWLIVKGHFATVRSMNDIALKDALIGHTVDGEADGDATSTNEHFVFGFAMSAATTFTDDNGSSLDCCEAMLTNCLYG